MSTDKPLAGQVALVAGVERDSVGSVLKNVVAKR